jgi:hypothetical protein
MADIRKVKVFTAMRLVISKSNCGDQIGDNRARDIFIWRVLNGETQ